MILDGELRDGHLGRSCGVQHAGGYGIERVLVDEDNPARAPVFPVSVEYNRFCSAQPDAGDVVQLQSCSVASCSKVCTSLRMVNFFDNGFHGGGVVAQQQTVAGLQRAFAHPANIQVKVLCHSGLQTFHSDNRIPTRNVDVVFEVQHDRLRRKGFFYFLLVYFNGFNGGFNTGRQHLHPVAAAE